MKTLLTPGKDTELIGLELADLADGEALELTRDAEIAAVILSGRRRRRRARHRGRAW